MMAMPSMPVLRRPESPAMVAEEDSDSEEVSSRRKPKVEILSQTSENSEVDKDEYEPGLLEVQSPTSYRLSNLPEVPDDFMTDIFSSLDRQQSIIQEEIEPEIGDGDEETFFDLPPVPNMDEVMDLGSLPPP